MRAVCISAPRQVEITDVPEPELGPEDVLVSIRCVGLCGSDLNAYRGLSPLVTYPRIPGHEVGGVITAVGGHVPDSVHAGTRVTIVPYSSCGRCAACRQGRPNCCRSNETLGVQRDGALLSRIAVHYSKVFTSSVLTSEQLALVEPFSVGYHATNRGRVTLPDTVVVLGCGTIGLGAIAAASQKGATVIGVDIDDNKLEKALSLGAQHTVNTSLADARKRIDALTDNEGASVVIEAVGLPATYRMAIDSVAFAGRVVCIGYAKERVNFDTKEIVRKEIDVLGSRNALDVFPAVIRMFEKAERPFADLVSRVYPLEETAQAFADWDSAPSTFTKILIRDP